MSIFYYSSILQDLRRRLQTSNLRLHLRSCTHCLQPVVISATIRSTNSRLPYRVQATVDDASSNYKQMISKDNYLESLCSRIESGRDNLNRRIKKESIFEDRISVEGKLKQNRKQTPTKGSGEQRQK